MQFFYKLPMYFLGSSDKYKIELQTCNGGSTNTFNVGQISGEA